MPFICQLQTPASLKHASMGPNIACNVALSSPPAYKYAWSARIAFHHTLGPELIHHYSLQLQIERSKTMASSKALLVLALLLAAAFLVASANNEHTRESMHSNESPTSS